MRSLYTTGFRHFVRSKPANIRPLSVYTQQQQLRIIQSKAAVQHRHFTSTPSLNAKYTRFKTDSERLHDQRLEWTVKVAAGIFVLAGVYVVVHLEKVPETGRWRFMDVSPKFETRMAEESHKQLVQEFHGNILPPNHPITRYVRKVVMQIIESSNLGTLKSDPSFITPSGVSANDVWAPDFERNESVVPGSGGREWQLMVVDDDNMINAMASFGNIVVFTGILGVTKDEDALAAVLGHEIAHVVARHNAERYSYAKLLIAFVALLEVLGLDNGFSQAMSTLLLDLPNSRAQELEADKIGLRLSSQACYEPQAAPEMFARLGRIEKSQGRLNLSFLYTHPTSEKRIKMLEKMLPEAYSIRAASPTCSGMQESFAAFLDANQAGWPSRSENTSTVNTTGQEFDLN